MKMFKTMGFRAGLVSALLLLVFLIGWYAATASTAGTGTTGASALSAEQLEYQKMMGKDNGSAKASGFPTPMQMSQTFVAQLSDPFYDRGPNEKGIAIQLGHSLGRVALGFLLACVVAIPMGFVIGMSPLLRRALDPFIQVLKPISPLA